MNFKYELEPTGDYAFIDMKSFYASCELVARGLHPLKHLLIVMSTTDNTSGLILASSPMAKKKLGIKNVTRRWDLPTVGENPAMKNLIIAPPRMNYYIQENLKIQHVLQNYAPDEDILWYSIDEGLIDLSRSLNYFVPGVLDRKTKLAIVCDRIQQDIQKKTGIFSTVGMSNSNPLLAKLALDNEAKTAPSLRASWNYSDVAEKVWQIPQLTDFWGIGHRTAARLHRLGISSVHELANSSPQLLQQTFGVIGLQLYHHANGIDRTKLSERYVPKETTIGNSQILPKDYTSSELLVVIREMAEQVAIRIRRQQLKTTSIHLCIGYSRDESTKGFSRQMKVDATNASKPLAESLLHLFHKFYDGTSKIRQIGVSYGKLVPANGTQLTLFDEPITQQKEEDLEVILDRIREKYGFSSIMRSSSLLPDARSLKRANLVGGHAGGAGGLDGLSPLKKEDVSHG
ncbi:Y-family DNA polymerase [Enterococcus italicus]